jgi:redox-sensitive bicupin YhaK (pirin superfamily)
MPTYSLTVFADQPGIVVQATQTARIAVIGGAPVGDRVIEWNFVSSRKARIEQAKRDWVEERFPKVPGDEVEFIPLP